MPTNEAERSSKVTFFSLPTEIRLQIYNLLLVSRFDPTWNPWLAVGRGETNQKKITCTIPDLNIGDDVDDTNDGSGYQQDRRDRTINPAILQTCKKIYHEANPILYSQNVFAIEKTEETFQFIRQIGFVNFKLIKKLEIWVPSYAKLSPWLGLLYLLAREASGLRCIRLCWDANLRGRPIYWERGAWDWVRGLGDNLLFERALGEIQGLDELVIEGYYAKNWPSYLEERMGVRVQAICGWYYTKYAREHNEMQLKLFTEYQQGTDALSNTMPETPKHNRPVASQPCTNEAKRSSKVTFFSLPPEIRLQIYNLLLVSRFDPTRYPRLAVGRGETNQKKITCKVPDTDDGSGYQRDRRDRTIEPAILQTCKKIYHEANPILYSQNVFAIEKTEETFQFIRQIGFVNSKLIKNLEIWVSSWAKLSPWLGLLYLLAREASGLRCIRLCWNANLRHRLGPRRYMERGAWDWVRGLGDNLLFVRALGEIQGLEELVIEGYYAKNWPSYLEERMGVQVQAICGWYFTKEDTFVHAREHNEMQLELFTEYQQGTENLIP